jgi:hypothetical protein
MATVLWRVVPNALTTPRSYRVLITPRNSADTEDLAADIALHHPNFNKADILTILNAEDEAILNRLINGEQVTKTGNFSWFLSCTGRLNSPEDPLPPPDESLHINSRVNPHFLERLCRDARFERLPMQQKQPLVTTARDTVLDLVDVLNPQGLLQLTGENLYFDLKQETGNCVIAGTESGSTTQSRFGPISDSEIIVMPNIPAQSNPWNNEYTVSISTHYTEHGTLRTGTYGRMLRTPLAVTGISLGHENGILSGKEAVPNAVITGGTFTADETLRIQVIQDLTGKRLLFSLLDMEEQGASGDVVAVTANGTYSLPGFAGSAVSSLEIRVDHYLALWSMIRNDYSGRLVDILDVSM